MALTIGAVVDLDFPARDAQLLAASGQICGWSAWSDEMIPAMLASLVGNAKFGDTHVVASGDVEVDAFAGCCSLEWSCSRQRRRDGRRCVYE
jgi:hypothetical protein